jgi:hypothetical protein
MAGSQDRRSESAHSFHEHREIHAKKRPSHPSTYMSRPINEEALTWETNELEKSEFCVENVL